MKDTRKILQRHPANPILDPENYSGIRQLFNPSPVQYGDEIIMLVSTQLYNATSGETRVARSKDGINFILADKPFINLDKTIYPYNIINRHIIDNRVTKIDDTYYILTPIAALGFGGPSTILGKTKDFENYELIDIISLPQNRGISLFPEKINGKYYRLDRPGAGDGTRFGPVWLSSSPDLIHWGQFRPVLKPFALWNWSKLGPTPPIKTDAGWLVIIHGVSDPCDGPHYAIGAVLLDIKEPWKVVGKTQSTLLYPQMDYETRGIVDNVVFPCGAIASIEKDELKLYYGAADTRICLASGSLSEIVNACIESL